MEVLPRVHSLAIGKGAFTGLFPPNVYLIADRTPVLVDTGYEAHAEERLGLLQGLGVSPACIFVTHPHVDHIGGAAFLRQHTGAKVLMHTADAPDQGVDGRLQGGEVMELGEDTLEVVHTPGHTPGAICLFLRERGVLLSGDHILGLGTTVITLPRGSMGQYMDSLRRLLALPLAQICPGHGPLVRDARAKVQELLQHRLEREEQVLSCLRRGRRRVDEMVSDIYNELDPRLVGMAQEQARAHLAKLVEEGRAVAHGEEYSLVGG